MSIPRVTVTDEARAVIDELRDDHGPLMFHQSGGCCDGSQPMCYPANEFKVGTSDIKLGDIHGCPFYIARDQYEYWQYMQLTIDVKPGRGASFSIEIPLGVRFITKSRMFEDDELDKVVDVQDAVPAE